VSIAYSVVGDGPLDLVFVSGWVLSVLETAWDGPAADTLSRLASFARLIRESVRELGLDVRAGLHTGECEVVDDKVGGIAVHIGARVAAEAGPGEVLVSNTVKDLVAGSGIGFVERGLVELKGVPGEWRLYSVDGSATAAA
jgi:class 3 adenylate cyclase